MNNCTVGRRVLIHLSCYSRHREDFVCPPEITQDGMALRLGISRAHVALELKRLKERRHVEYRLAHVVKAKCRRKVYHLTQAGEELARELRDEASRKKVRLLDGNGGLECTGHEAMKVLCSRGLAESEALIKILTCEAIPITNGTPNGNGHKPSTSDGSIGREPEAARLERWLRTPGKAVCVLTGPSGVGKSSLAAALTFKNEGCSVWQDIWPLQSVRSLLAGIAKQIQPNGNGRLSSLLTRDEFDNREAVLTLIEEMGGGLLILDGVHNSAEVENFASLFLAVNDWPLKVLLLSRRKPGFCQRWSDTFQKPYEDIALAGLDVELARKLLTMYVKTATDEGTLAAHAATQGRPLDLTLLADLGWSFDSPQVPDLGDMLFSRLKEEEIDFLRFAAIVRSPIDPARMQLTPAQASILQRGSLFQKKDDCFSLHDSVRNLVVERTAEKERSSQHEKAAAYEESNGDAVWAAAHHMSAGSREKAVSLLAQLKDASAWRGRAAELLWVMRALGDDLRLEFLKGKTLESLGRLDDARLCYERALTADGAASVELLLTLADLENRLSLHKDSERHFFMAVSFSREQGDELGRARAIEGLGRVYKSLGDVDQAARHLADACEILERAGEWKQALKCKGALGALELERGNSAGCVVYLTAAIHGSGQYGVESASLLSHLGTAYLRLGDEKSALTLFSESIQVAESFGQLRLVAHSMTSAAESCIRIGKSGEAEELCRKALKLGERLGDPVLLSTVHATLGLLNRTLGLWNRAESHIVSSIELLKPLNSPKILAKRYKELAALYETTGDTRKARLWSTRAERMIEWEEPSPVAQPVLMRPEIPESF